MGSMGFVYFIKTKLQIIVFLCLLFSCGSPRSKVQSWEDNSKALLHLTKQQLVQRAQEIIKTDLGTYVPHFYEKRVFYADHEVVVVFYLTEHFAAKGDFYYYGATVELQSESKTYLSFNNSNLSNASELWSFYHTSTTKKANINKVISKIAHYENTAVQSLFPKDHQLKILEREEASIAKVITPSYTDIYQLEKGSFEVLSKTSRTQKRPTLDQLGYTEIH